MPQRQLIVDLPFGLDPDEARTLFAATLFDRRRLSLGKAAELAGYSKRAFIEVLGHLGIDVIQYGPEEFEAERAAWQRTEGDSSEAAA